MHIMHTVRVGLLASIMAYHSCLTLNANHSSTPVAPVQGTKLTLKHVSLEIIRVHPVTFNCNLFISHLFRVIFTRIEVPTAAATKMPTSEKLRR